METSEPKNTLTRVFTLDLLTDELESYSIGEISETEVEKKSLGVFSESETQKSGGKCQSDFNNNALEPNELSQIIRRNNSYITNANTLNSDSENPDSSELPNSMCSNEKITKYELKYIDPNTFDIKKFLREQLSRITNLMESDKLNSVYVTGSFMCRSELPLPIENPFLKLNFDHFKNTKNPTRSAENDSNFFLPIPFNSLQAKSFMSLSVLPNFNLQKSDNYEYFSFSRKHLEIERKDWVKNIEKVQGFVEKSMNLKNVKLELDKLLVFKEGCFFKGGDAHFCGYHGLNETEANFDRSDENIDLKISDLAKNSVTANSVDNTSVGVVFILLQSEYTGGEFKVNYLGFEESIRYGSVMDGCNFIGFRNGVDQFEISKINSGCMVCLKYSITTTAESPSQPGSFQKLTDVYQLNPYKLLTNLWNPTKQNLKFLIQPIVQLNKVKDINDIKSMFPVLTDLINEESLCCYVCQLSGQKYLEIEKWKVEEEAITPELAFFELTEGKILEPKPKENYKVSNVQYVHTKHAKNYPFPSRLKKVDAIKSRYFVTDRPFQPSNVTKCIRVNADRSHSLIDFSKNSIANNEIGKTTPGKTDPDSPNVMFIKETKCCALIIFPVHQYLELAIRSCDSKNVGLALTQFEKYHGPIGRQFYRDLEALLKHLLHFCKPQHSTVSNLINYLEKMMNSRIYEILATSRLIPVSSLVKLYKPEFTGATAISRISNRLDLYTTLELLCNDETNIDFLKIAKNQLKRLLEETSSINIQVMDRLIVYLGVNNPRLISLVLKPTQNYIFDVSLLIEKFFQNSDNLDRPENSEIIPKSLDMELFRDICLVLEEQKYEHLFHNSTFEQVLYHALTRYEACSKLLSCKVESEKIFNLLKNIHRFNDDTTSNLNYTNSEKEMYTSECLTAFCIDHILDCKTLSENYMVVLQKMYRKWSKWAKQG